MASRPKGGRSERAHAREPESKCQTPSSNVPTPFSVDRELLCTARGPGMIGEHPPPLAPRPGAAGLVPAHGALFPLQRFLVTAVRVRVASRAAASCRRSAHPHEQVRGAGRTPRTPAQHAQCERAPAGDHCLGRPLSHCPSPKNRESDQTCLQWQENSDQTPWDTWMPRTGCLLHSHPAHCDDVVASSGSSGVGRWVASADSPSAAPPASPCRPPPT